MIPDDNTQSRSWLYMMAGLLCSILSVNIVVIDIIAVLSLVDFSK